MLNALKRPYLIFLFGLLLLLAACGTDQQSWSGLTKTESGEIFVSYEQFIAKLDENGQRQWAYPDQDDRDKRFFAGATVADDVVYVGDYTGGVHAIDRETGERIWNYSEGEPTRLFGFISFGGSTDRVIAPVTLGNGHIFVPNERGIFMLDRETGERLNLEGEADSDAVVLETDRAVWSQPLYLPASDDQPERLIVSSLDHHLYNLNLEDGSLLWKRDIDGAAASLPALVDEEGVLFVGTFNSEVVAVDLQSGEILDRYEAEGWVWDSPAVADGMLYFSDLEGYVYAVEFTGGSFSEDWKKRITEDKIRPRPLVLDELLVVVSEEGEVFGLERDTGNEEWNESIDGKLLSPLVVLERTQEDERETLIITATDNADRMVVALRADNGNPRWEYEHKD